MTIYDDMRIGTADRERAADVLKAALTEGRLTHDEFDERLDDVMNRARTYGELHRIVGDLPSGAAPQPTAQPVYAVQPYTPYYPARPSTNGLAVASLVSSLFWFVWFGSVAGVIFGHVALKQIRRDNGRGESLAIAGLVIGYLELAVAVLLIILGFSH